MSYTINKASVVAVYNHPEEVKQTVRKLKKTGFDIKKLSIVRKGYHSRSSLFVISGIGPIAVSGPLVGEIVRTFGKGVIRPLSAFHRGMSNIGLSRESVFQYESALKKGFCLVCARGPVDEMAQVKRFFTLSKAIEIKIHYQ